MSFLSLGKQRLPGCAISGPALRLRGRLCPRRISPHLWHRSCSYICLGTTLTQKRVCPPVCARIYEPSPTAGFPAVKVSWEYNCFQSSNPLNVILLISAAFVANPCSRGWGVEDGGGEGTVPSRTQLLGVCKGWL